MSNGARSEVEISGSSSNEPLVDKSEKIKQEKTQKYLLHDISKSDRNRNIIYYCRLCKDEMASFRSVIQHRTDVHGFRPFNLSSTGIKHIDLIPDVLNPNYHCDSCEKTMSSSRSYRQHQNSAHHMKLLYLKLAPRNASDPDPNNANFYCASCDRHYHNRTRYRYHLRCVHKMKLVHLVKNRPRKNSDIPPDWHDANNYCKSCGYTFSSKCAFRTHCIKYHHMEPPKVKRLNPNDPNFNCSICDVKFISKTNLLYHYLCYHSRHKRLPNPNVVPDISDPKNYCKSCEKYFSRKYSYVTHLRYRHRILGPPSLIPKPEVIEPVEENISKFLYCECGKTLSTKQNFKVHLHLVHSKYQTKNRAGELPDPDDPDFHCRICETKYPRGGEYRHHLRLTHWMKLKPIKTYVLDPNFLPDPQSSNPYCRACKKTFNLLYRYKSHCRSTHQMTWSPFVHPDAQIDINSPDLYCAKCNKHLARRLSFKYHLQQVHTIRQTDSTSSR